MLRAGEAKFPLWAKLKTPGKAGGLWDAHLKGAITAQAA
jgi:hypothetical protein